MIECFLNGVLATDLPDQIDLNLLKERQINFAPVSILCSDLNISLRKFVSSLLLLTLVSRPNLWMMMAECRRKCQRAYVFFERGTDTYVPYIVALSPFLFSQ
ncbi:hypothetical protein Ciccas_008491 [Cichlidogyrus casuarinus]|uniref:Uncharacterized protein n=1 Tax=Cichlidogyrus casuarinus TaxID=1844966 RepID=A0ABD2Q2F4_9PLAT